MVGTSLKALRTTCVPRRDILEGGLADNHFAAQLDKVIRDAEHYPIYGNPDSFFAQTYPTSGLKLLLKKVFGRIAAVRGTAGENGILRPTTSFGGGKTHGLTAVWHLAKGARPSNIAEFLDPSLLPETPVQVAALVGDALDPTAGVETQSHRTFTLWGELAAQIGEHAYAVMELNDSERTAPGTGTIMQALDRKPTIIIIDEIAKYLRAVSSSGNEDVRRMARAIPVFLGNLFEVASDPTNRVSVVITLASTTNAFGDETTEISAITSAEDSDRATVKATALKAIEETAEVLTRAVQPSAVIRPADDNEIGEILKKRIFEFVDREAAEAAGAAYRRLYESLGRNEQLAGGAENAVTYGELVTKTYPFHPELVRVLDKRLGNITQFQRARGALKLLAEVVANIYKRNEDVPIINVGDIDYANDAVLSHLTDGLGRAEYSSVAIGDFAGPSSHAAALDSEIFPNKPGYITRVARTVFTHSLEMVATAGAGRNDWLVGTLRPGEDGLIFEKALSEAEKVFWHLSYDGSRWRFNIEPNVNAIIETEKRNVANTAVSAMVDSLIRNAFANDGGAKTVHFPSGPAEVPDEPSLRVVVLDHNVVTVNQKEAEKPPHTITEILEKSGSVGSPRKYRNAVVFALPDEEQITILKDRARALIASNSLANDTARLSQFSGEVRKKVEAYDKQAALNARIAVNRCYKHIYYPSSDKTMGYLRHRELPAQAQGDTRNVTAAVITLLTDESKIRTDSFSASYLRSKTWPNARSVTTRAVIDYFWTDHTVQIVRNPALIREAIINGVKNENWVYFDASIGKAYSAHSMAGFSPEIKSDAEIMILEEAEERGLLARKPTQADLRAILTDDQLTGTEIRERLEEQCGGEPSKSEVLELLATAVQSSDYTWFVVVDINSSNNMRALTPSAIKSRGLDSFRVVSREIADAEEIEIPTRSVIAKTFTGSGPGGAALQKIIDQISDYVVNTLAKLVIRVSADSATGTGDIDLVIAALGMLQNQEISVRAQIRAEYRGISGGIAFNASGDRQDFQAAYNQVKKSLAGAETVVGNLELTFTFSPVIHVLDPKFEHLQSVVRNLALKNTTISAEASK